MVIFLAKQSHDLSGWSHDLKMAAPIYGDLSKEESVLFVCDLQQKFKPVIQHFESVVEGANRLVSMQSRSILHSSLYQYVLYYIIIYDASSFLIHNNDFSIHTIPYHTEGKEGSSKTILKGCPWFQISQP